LTYKPSKVLIIGSGPIIIGHFYCHSGASAASPKNLVAPGDEILHCVQDDRRDVQDDNVTKEHES